MITLAVMAGLLLCGPASPTPGVCACDVAMSVDGWCDIHGLGYLGGVEITSERLYTVLDAHGHELDLDTFQCVECKGAIATGDWCDEHRVGFVNGLVYHSRLSYLLARAEKRSFSEVTCPVCREHAQARGWCDSCGVGMVGRVVFDDKEVFEEISRALHLLEVANETAERCERCAVAIATDSICVKCRLGYRDGEASPIVPEATDR